METIAYDLRTKAGVLTYIGALLTDIRTIYTQHGHLHAFGAVFASRLKDEVRELPIPVSVGQPGMPRQTLKKFLQKASKDLEAVGAVFARLDTFQLRAGNESSMVVVQVEHKTFPDLLWYARVRSRQLEPFLGPFELGASAPLAINKTAFLPQRWMS